MNMFFSIGIIAVINYVVLVISDAVEDGKRQIR